MKKVASRDEVKSPDAQPVPIEKAYEELTHAAYAVWTLLMVIGDDVLVGGRTDLAKHIGHSQSRTNEILRELKNKGYIQLIGGESIGEPTKIQLELLAMISGRNHFVRLSDG